MAIALHAGVSARPELGAASRFGTSRSDVLSGVYAEHYDRLMGFFVRRTRDRLLAEDLTQDTIVRFVRSCDTFDVSRPAWPYLKTTANNVLIDHLRRAERQVDMDVEEELDEEECLEPTPDSLLVLREMLSEALGQLPDRQRIAVDLRYERGWSVPDAADFLGVSPGTFGQLLFRARQTMRDYLDSVGTSVHGVALPALLALRWRWRTWSAKGREVAQTPVTAMSMEAVASVVVAATLGVSAVVAAGSSPAAPDQEITAAEVRPSAIDDATIPTIALAESRTPPGPSDLVNPVGGTGVDDQQPPSGAAPPIQASIETPEVPTDANGGVTVGEQEERFVVSSEVRSRTGLPIESSDDDDLWLRCNNPVGELLCSARDD